MASKSQGGSRSEAEGRTEAERLAVSQRAREAQEEALRQTSQDPDEAHTHERRAEKAGYLRRRLEEQADADARAEAEPREEEARGGRSNPGGVTWEEE